MRNALHTDCLPILYTYYIGLTMVRGYSEQTLKTEL